MLNERLGEVPYLAGDYSIADIAVWPWVSRFEWQTINLNDHEHVRRWYVEIAARPAVVKGYHVPMFVNEVPMPLAP